MANGDKLAARLKVVLNQAQDRSCSWTVSTCCVSFSKTEPAWQCFSYTPKSSGSIGRYFVQKKLILQQW